MGGNNTKPKTKTQKMFQMTCQDDLQCQNINASKSIPGQDPVLVCPEAKCMSGTCACGPNCTKDPYMGFCCKSVEERVSKNASGQEDKTTFCIENFSNSVVCGYDFN